MKSILCFLFGIVVVCTGLSYMPSGMLEQTDEVEETASQDAQEGVDPTAEDTAARPDDLKSSAP